MKEKIKYKFKEHQSGASNQISGTYIVENGDEIYQYHFHFYRNGEQVWWSKESGVPENAPSLKEIKKHLK